MAGRKPIEDPDKLVRDGAGRYRTADERFTVEGGGASGWFVGDAEQANELGLPLLRGPFGTLDEARTAIAEARSAPPPKAPPPKAPTRPQVASRQAAAARRPPAHEPTAKGEPRQEPTWLERLPTDHRRTAEQLLAALNAASVPDAEALVRRDVDAKDAVVAGWIVADRAKRQAVAPWEASRWSRSDQRRAKTLLDALVKAGADDADIRELSTEVAKRSVERTLSAVQGEGFTPGQGRPVRSWRLIELDENGKPTGRSVDLQQESD